MKIVCFGEVLIDFLNVKDNLFEANPGGAPANVAAAIAKFGGKSYLISQVGNDMFGKMILDSLSACGVDVSNVKMTDEYFTTLAFVKLDSSGERSFSFSRKYGADVYLKVEDIDMNIVRSADIFHFGSLSMTYEQNKKTTLELLKIARQSGSTISYDPNYRSSLWDSQKMALDTMIEPVENGFVDILKMSEEEVLLYEKSVDDFYNRIKDKVKIFLVTFGEKGSMAFFRGKSYFVDTIKVDVVDTTGCGDCFVGMVLYEISKSLPIENLSEDEIIKIVRKANIAGALCATKKGAIPAIPEYNQVLEWL
ncbi:carbohydrate kinase family protein [Anaerocellum danielii]|uniref:Carbohydrate kinase n=1 Tax=Anaerocellum danielii TaxID=1387557 RepID=A0ABZ0TZR9_9FIRM|nr:carbohydrate kinase [Caldicellulosiruptor danielii]WPX08357.1 carbohydrate kinase [Caldicellulosiruptor danielii]